VPPTQRSPPSCLPRTNAELAPVEVARRVAASLPHPEKNTRPLFIVDDAHLLDDRSAQVLLQLAAEHGITILATAHDAELPVGVERLCRDGWCERLHLGALDQDDVLELIEPALDAPIEHESALAFARRAEGIPLVVRELVSSALDSGTLVRRGPGWALRGEPTVTSQIRDLVRTRMGTLPQAIRAALETIAAGEPLPLQVALELVGEAQLDELEVGRLITLRAGLAGPR
jgi:hypothetical protein